MYDGYNSVTIYSFMGNGDESTAYIKWDESGRGKRKAIETNVGMVQCMWRLQKWKRKIVGPTRGMPQDWERYQSWYKT